MSIGGQLRELDSRQETLTGQQRSLIKQQGVVGISSLENLSTKVGIVKLHHTSPGLVYTNPLCPLGMGVNRLFTSLPSSHQSIPVETDNNQITNSAVEQMYNYTEASACKKGKPRLGK